ncbi:MAG TPA: O-antigen ligase family protein [Terriglobales bacterium]|nr:O-antigen ligase family protein [Terriglobales bacterium]
MRSRGKLLLIAGVILSGLLLLWYARARPGLFSNTKYLGGILLLELIGVALWNYSRVFFPFLMAVFAWVAMDVPLSQSAGNPSRWVVLFFGAAAGCLLWMKKRRDQRLTLFHLMALFCVISALVSAVVSDSPDISLLKVLSLFMLFLYCTFGARFAIAGREGAFIGGLVLVCEMVVYASALSYLVLGKEVYGNRNALGAVIGVATFPVLAWAALATDNVGTKRRLTVCLLLSGFLLYFSSSRASLAGALVSGVILCLVTAQQRALYRGAFLSALFLTFAAAVNPNGFADFLSAQTTAIVYKQGTSDKGVFASREGPWKDTVESIKKHPWFGSGFGTSDLGETDDIETAHTHSLAGSNREHGNSYLAMAEYMGLVGILPFLGLILLTLRNVFKVCSWMRREHTLRSYVVPLTMLIIAGLVHAFFEDWLFAVGNYLCLYFWFCAFAVTDFVSRSTASVPVTHYSPHHAWAARSRLAIPAIER